MTALADKKSGLIQGSTGMIVDGVFASEVWDSSGEVLDIAGCDISDMEQGRGLANYEHRNDESVGATAQDVVGKIIHARKIFKESDCEDDRERYFWEKVKVPFIYGMVRLYDGAGHLSAQALAAQIRDHVANKEPILVRFSIDGSTIEKQGNRLKYTLGRRVAMTIKPCNKTCDSGLVIDPQAPEGFEKRPESLAKKEHPLYARLGSSGDVEQVLPEQDVLLKAMKNRPQKVQHYSNKEGLTRLDPRKQGTGATGAEKNRPKRIPRTYYYTDPGEPEAVVTGSSPHRYTGQLPPGTKLYDLEADPMGLMESGMKQTPQGQMYVTPDLDDVEKKIKAAGYHGYTNYGVPSALAFFHPLDVQYSPKKLGKALTAGGGGAAPGALEGGAALQREDLRKRITEVVKAYDESKGSLKDFMKSQLPDVSDEYIDHFVALADGVKAKLRKADTSQSPADRIAHFRSGTNRSVKDSIDDIWGQPNHERDPGVAFPPPEEHDSAPDLEEEVDDEDEDDDGPARGGVKGPLTILGKPVRANPHLKKGQLIFNEHTGELQHPLGTYKLYNPDEDGDSGKYFRDVWNSPAVRKQHDYAVGNWIKLNKAMKEGRLPEAVLATSVAFSQLSPNTPVPVHEMTYAYLLDTFKKQGFDIRDPRFASQSVKDDWMARDTPHGWPQSSRDYFTNEINKLVTNQNDSLLTSRAKGERSAFMLPNDKFKNMSRYAPVHDFMRDLVSRHGIDGRGAVAELMKGKSASKLWEAARARHIKAGKPDIGPYRGLHIPGLAPKTARFAYAMMGAGNSFVPDTHFSRHLFGLDKEKDASSIRLVRNKVLWKEQNSELLNAMDRWYFRNHPAVKLMLEHPEYGEYFKANPEQAVFPAFWGHWLSISPHEQLMKHRGAKKASNQAASHRPLFEEVDRILQDPKEAGKAIPARTTPIAADPAPQAALPFGGRQPRSALIPKTPRKKLAKSENGEPLIDPRIAAGLLASWVQEHGEAEAMFRYYSQLLPLLMHESPAEHHDPMIKAEQLSVDLAILADKLAKDERGGTVKQDQGSAAQAARAAADRHFQFEAEAARPQSPATANERGGQPVRRPPAVARPMSTASPVHPGILQHTPENDKFNNTPEQQALVHGLDLSKRLARPAHASDPDDHINGAGAYWLQHPDGRLVFAKSDANSYENGAQREVAYHNLARDFFGLGRYVPLTAYASNPHQRDWNYSVMEAVPDAEHSQHKNQRQIGILKALGDRGELHKLALMNYLLGNADRHLNNFLYTTDGLKLIDHGHTFADPFHRNLYVPAYLARYEKLSPHKRTLHPEAAEWLRGLDPAKLQQMASAYLSPKASEGLAKALQLYKERWLTGAPVLPRPLNGEQAPYY